MYFHNKILNEQVADDHLTRYQDNFPEDKKIGGTSMGIVLSKFCGESDVITPITLPVERAKQKLGGS